MLAVNTYECNVHQAAKTTINPLESVCTKYVVTTAKRLARSTIDPHMPHGMPLDTLKLCMSIEAWMSDASMLHSIGGPKHLL